MRANDGWAIWAVFAGLLTVVVAASWVIYWDNGTSNNKFAKAATVLWFIWVAPIAIRAWLMVLAS